MSDSEAGDHTAVDIVRIGWLIIAVAFGIGMLTLLFEREWGYGAVSGAVAISAAINLF